MLTPRFSLSQDADFLYINITAPYIKLAESECYIHEDEFYFYSQPYYLRLHLPGKIIENHLSTSQYDVDTGQLTVRVAKETRGDVFEGLDMLTKLLTPKKATGDNGDIEVISSSIDESNALSEGNEENELEFDWFLEQKVNETHCLLLINSPSYGFAHRKSNDLNVLVTSLPNLLDLKDPVNVPASERTMLRKQQEREQFNCEHYLADFFDDEMINDVISPDYPELTGTVGKETVFTETEKEKLLQLPRREYIINDQELKAVYLGLVDLVFAYAYDFRLTRGEPNVESDWTICKLSATLSWLDSFENINDVIFSCARRSLCFPLYRSWKLFHRVLGDVKNIFLTGRSQVLKCLLGIHKVLAESESRYPFNDLYITDYCVWLQNADSKKIESVGKALDEVKISKSDLGLRIDEMETDARKLTECACDENGRDSCEKRDDIERLADALSDIVKVKDAVVVDSDDDDHDSGNSEDGDNCSGDGEYDDCSSDSEDDDCTSDDESSENEDEDAETTKADHGIVDDRVGNKTPETDNHMINKNSENISVK